MNAAVNKSANAPSINRMKTAPRIALALLIASHASAADSALGGFESAARDTGTRSTSSYSSTHHHGHHGYSVHDDGGLWLAAFYISVVGAVGSLSRLQPGEDELDDVAFSDRPLGESLIPFATVEADYHYVDDKIDGTSGAFEIGYGPFAFRMRQEKFTEDLPGEPDAELDLTEKIGLLRLSFGSTFELDVGGGEITVDGETRESQTVFTTPARWLVTPWLNLCFRPTWGESLEIYDAAIEPGFNFARLRLGYRWTETEGKDLSGPYAGASLTF